MYLTNDANSRVAKYNNQQPGWSTATQEEIDAYLLAQAKLAKITDLVVAREDFSAAGFLYSGNIFLVSDGAIENIALKDSLLGYESDNVSAMASTQAYILPAGHVIRADPGQIITVSGFTEASNNGVKTVNQLDVENGYLVVDETLVDEAAGDAICIYDANRYKFYDIDSVMVDFANKTAWDVFFSAITNKRDRIMVYYCSTKGSINDCADVAAVAAIVIDFAAWAV